MKGFESMHPGWIITRDGKFPSVTDSIVYEDHLIACATDSNYISGKRAICLLFEIYMMTKHSTIQQNSDIVDSRHSC